MRSDLSNLYALVNRIVGFVMQYYVEIATVAALAILIIAVWYLYKKGSLSWRTEKGYVRSGVLALLIPAILSLLIFEFRIINPDYLRQVVINNALSITNISLTAGSILLSFFLTILTDEKLQIGRGKAFLIWLSITLFLVSGVISLLTILGLDSIISLLTMTNLLFALGILLILMGMWVLKRGYYEDISPNTEFRCNVGNPNPKHSIKTPRDRPSSSNSSSNSDKCTNRRRRRQSKKHKKKGGNRRRKKK